MKLLIAFPIITLAASASAWNMDFLSADGHEWKTNGRNDVSYNRLSKDWYGKHNTKYIHWNPETSHHTDPTKAYVYEGKDCTGGNWGLKKKQTR
jgi:hypothetical protein